MCGSVIQITERLNWCRSIRKESHPHSPVLIRSGSEFPQLFLARKFFPNSCFPCPHKRLILCSIRPPGRKKTKSKLQNSSINSYVICDLVMISVEYINTKPTQCRELAKKHNILITLKDLKMWTKLQPLVKFCILYKRLHQTLNTDIQE